VDRRAGKEIESLGLRNQTNDEPDQRDEMGGAASPVPTRRPKRFVPFLLTFLIMFALWIPLSGKFDLFHLSLGIISCALVAYLSADLLFESTQKKGLLETWIRFVCYLPWLLYQIWLCNLHLLKLAFHPRMLDLIDPQVVKFRSKLKGDLARVTFANSITLTPGTITISVSIDGDFSVHAIDKQSAEGLPGEMEARIARVFGEE